MLLTNHFPRCTQSTPHPVIVAPLATPAAENASTPASFAPPPLQRRQPLGQKNTVGAALPPLPHTRRASSQREPALLVCGSGGTLGAVGEELPLKRRSRFSSRSRAIRRGRPFGPHGHSSWNRLSRSASHTPPCPRCRSRPHSARRSDGRAFPGRRARSRCSSYYH